ncbi:MAG: glycosyltransferase family 2 protein [Erysipelotrichaceae bacterium]|nr:glycosyltransferase family 2 protein [Erysipelotrichaceae bacterium]
MKTLVIIPAFNEAANIENLTKELISFGYDYLIINDGSTDNTAAILRENGYSFLDLKENVGIAGVTKVGFRYAWENGYDAAIVIDGDGQHPPGYIHTLLKEVAEGYDYVVGSRFVTGKKPFTARMLGSRLLCSLIRLKTGRKVTDPTSGMRAMGKRVLADFAENMNFIAEPDALCYVLKRGYTVREIQVEMKEREAGTSYFASPFKSLRYMITVIISILFVQW